MPKHRSKYYVSPEPWASAEDQSQESEEKTWTHVIQRDGWLRVNVDPPLPTEHHRAPYSTPATTLRLPEARENPYIYAFGPHSCPNPNGSIADSVAATYDNSIMAALPEEAQRVFSAAAETRLLLPKHLGGQAWINANLEMRQHLQASRSATLEPYTTP